MVFVCFVIRRIKRVLRRQPRLEALGYSPGYEYPPQTQAMGNYGNQDPSLYAAAAPPPPKGYPQEPEFDAYGYPAENYAIRAPVSPGIKAHHRRTPEGRVCRRRKCRR